MSKAISKKDAIRQALELNPAASAGQIVEIVRKKHGIETSVHTVYSVKAAAENTGDIDLSSISKAEIDAVRKVAEKVGGPERLLELARALVKIDHLLGGK